VLQAVDESTLPVIPDKPGKQFNPSKMDAIPSTGSNTRAFGNTKKKRLPPAPTTKEEIIRLMKKPKQSGGTRSFGDNKSRSPKARAYINFDVNKAEIRPEAYPLLNEWGGALISGELSDAMIKVLGHTDSTGSDSSNLRLSERRAESVQTYLIGRFNVEPSRFQIVPRGESQPYASNRTEAGRALNRRVEFVLNYSAASSSEDEQFPVNSPTEDEEPYYE
jgi:outer membrane protein OmpA-like peptidoglycan-associated protein